MASSAATRTAPATTTLVQRILDHCKTIWGNDTDYYKIDINIEGRKYYQGVVREDRGDLFGQTLTVTGFCSSEEDTLKELDRMLGMYTALVLSGEPITKAQLLEIFEGPDGSYKLSSDMIYKEIVKAGKEREEREEREGKEGIFSWLFPQKVEKKEESNAAPSTTSQQNSMMGQNSALFGSPFPKTWEMEESNAVPSTTSQQNSMMGENPFVTPLSESNAVPLSTTRFWELFGEPRRNRDVSGLFLDEVKKGEEEEEEEEKGKEGI